jgi:hypothetical protein
LSILSINSSIGEITIVWIEIGTWAIEKVALEEGPGRGMG